VTTDLLGELQAGFPSGATAGVFDATVVAGGEYMSLLDGLGVPTLLHLTSQNGWQVDQSAGAITLDGTTTTSILGVAGAPVRLAFTPSGTDYVLVLDLQLPGGWGFGQSFPLLNAGVFPDLPVVHPPADDPSQASALIVASGSALDSKRTVSGSPLQVARGLTFFGFLDESAAALGILGWIFATDGGELSAPIALTGPIAFDAGKGTVDMSLPLPAGSAGQPFGASSPKLALDVALWSGPDPLDGHYVGGIQFGATLPFAKLSALLEGSDEGVLELSLSGLAVALPSKDTIASYFGAGNGILDALPAQLLDDLSALQLNDVLFGIGLQTKTLEYAALEIGVPAQTTWPIWAGELEVSDPSFSMAIFNPFGDSPTPAFAFQATFDLGDSQSPVPIVVQGELPAEVFTGALDPDVPAASLKPLLEHVGLTAGVPDDLAIARLDFAADVGQKLYSADVEIEGDWSFDFGTGNQVVFEDLALGFTYAPGAPAGRVAARFAVGENDFDVAFEMTAGNTSFTGSWEDTGTPLTYQDIAIALGMYGLPNLPDALDLSLKSVTFEFDSAGPTFGCDVRTASYGGATLVAGKSTAGEWGFVFGMEMNLDLKLDLTDIDVVGQLVPAGDDVIALDALRMVGATTAVPQLTQAELQALGGLVNSGLALSVDLRVGNALQHTFTVRFGGSDDGSRWDAPPDAAPAQPPGPPPAPATALASSDAPPASASPGPQVTWVNVQRSFGPVHIDRVGFSLTQDDRLALELDASAALGGLTVGLRGLEGDIPLESPYTPSFALAGLDVEYAGGGLTIAGGLSRAPGVTPAEYTGELVFTMGEFGATAIGSYTTVDDEPSLFAFLFVDYPLGGPPFFFVTGLAGGLGYNRSLQLPAPDAVAGYPLVQAATGQLDAETAQARLDALIATEVNEYWLAAGVAFTSFEMVRSFALLTVSFGTHVEVALMGTSTITVPVSTPDDPATPVATAQLGIIVDYNPGAGQLAASAQLGPGSYVFDPAAQLSGGFAFYSWFAPSANAGDFVLTLGGYNPSFSAPAHYPQVPRLGLNWQVSGDLAVKGDLYFALTPSVLMAGGGLDATWQSGDISAWFDASADFLIRFKPFQYTIDVSISIGASFTIDLLFTSVTITIHVGVDLDIWGPEFGGQATVDLSIISFTVSFGADPPAAAADIGWAEFKQSFLAASSSSSSAPPAPAPAVAQVADAPPSPPTTQTDSLVTISASSGLLKTTGAADSSAGWTVDPAQLQIAVATRIPSTSASVVTATESVPAGTWNDQVGVGPMGVGMGGLTAGLTITIERDGGPDEDVWKSSALTGAVPSALWANTGTTMQQDGLVHDTLTGVALVPDPPAPDQTVPVAIGELLVDEPQIVNFDWSQTTVPTTDSYAGKDSMAELKQKLVAPDGDRTAVLAALIAQGLTTAPDVNVAAYAASAPDLLASPPLLRVLGEELAA
jgi:hypothetical protein